MPYRAMAVVAVSFLFATQSFAEPLTDKGSKSNATSRSHSNAISFGAAGIKGKTTQPGGTNSNTNDRMGAGGGGKGAVQRMGGGGGRGGGARTGIGADITGFSKGGTTN
jgi:hypothetical protein